MAKTRNRNKDVLDYLKGHADGISSQYGALRFKCRNFPDVIHNLRKHGHKIETIMADGSNEYGHYSYAVYYYRGEASDDNKQ